MANGNEGPALGINVQADVGAAHPATIGAAGGLVGAIDQRTTIHGPTNTSWGIRGGCHTAHLHGIADLGLVGAAQINVLGGI